MRFVALVCALLAAGLLALVWGPVRTVRPQDDNPVGTSRRPPLIVEDSSGLGNDGVNQGDPQVGLRGYRGTAYSFDRLGSWIQVPSNPTLNPYRRDFLMSAWVNLKVAPRAPDTYDVVRKGLSWTPGGEYKLEIVAGGWVRCSVKDSTGTVARVLGPKTSLADGRWHRVGCARTGSTWSVLVDRTVTSESAKLGSVSNAMPLSIGSKYGWNDIPDGRIDEVALFVASGQPARVARLVVRPKARIQQLRSGTPVGRWDLDEVAPETTPDPLP